MSVFTIQAPDGRKIKIEAGDEATAVKGAAEWAKANPKATEPAPEGLKPGSSEYADWALSQVKAGKPVPQVSEHSAPAEPASPYSNPIDAINAGFSSSVNSIPFVGDKLTDALNSGRSFVQTNWMNNPMTPEEVAAETRAREEANPAADFAGQIIGPTVALAPLGLTQLGARGLGLVGSTLSRTLFGGGSGALIAGGDSLTRGNDLGEAGVDALIGGGLGSGVALAGKGLGWLKDLVLGRSAPREAKAVARALTDDGVPVDQINQRLTELGPDAMVMDLGPNLQSQAGAVASVPGPGQRVTREAVNTRRQGATQRVNNDVAQTIGSQPDVGALREGIVTAQQQAADPLYAAVRDVPLQNLPQLAAVARTPMGQQALREARRMLANDGITIPDGQFTVGLADYMKRALDDIASSSGRAGNNNLARQARNMTRAITSAVDPVVPGYRAARDAFAGPAQVLDAIEGGMTAFSKEMSPPQLQRELAAMSASERDAFLQGAQAQVEALMGNAVNDVASLRNTFRKGWNEAKLRILLGDDIATDLMQRIDRESTFGQTANVVSSNSETARRLAAQGEVNPSTGNVAQPGKTFLGLFFDAFNAARNGIEGVRQPQINRSMAEIHTSRQLSPATVRMLQNGSRAQRPGTLPPAVAPLVEQRQRREPIEITVGIGSR